VNETAQLPLEGRDSDALPTWYLLTNTLNLRAWMARRLAFGREGFEKYYADTPDLADGRLVLLPGPPGPDLIEYATSEAPDLLPALVTVDVNAMEGIHPASGPVVVDGVIHEGYLGPVLLPDEAAVSNFLSRSFENVPAALEVRAAPEVFRAGTWTRADIESLEPPATNRDPIASDVDLESADRLSGGMISLAAATRCRPTEFSTLVAVLNGKGPTGAFEPVWLVNDSRGSEEAMVFRAVRSVLQATDPVKDWRPLEVLSEIQDALEGLSLSGDTALTAAKHCERIREILKAERDFEPLKPGGLRPLKAVLLTLLRRELPRQLAWDPSESGATSAERRTAAYYAGLLSRRSRLPLDLRPDGLDRLLADMEAAQIGGPGPRRFDPSALTSGEGPVEGGTGCVLSAGEELLLSLSVGEISVSERVRATVARSDSGDDTALAIARAAEWDDVITSVIGPLADVRLVAEKKGRVTLRVSGLVEVREEIDLEQLWSRLSEAEADDLPSSVIERLHMPTPSELEELEAKLEP
jgi:hypothetical protein